MKRSIPILLSLLICGGSSQLFSQTPVQTRAAEELSPSKKMLAAGEKMISDFKVTRYSHKTFIDRDQSICEVDCSGFVVALLKQTSPDHLRQIATHHKRPLAEDFFETFQPDRAGTRRGWKPIGQLKQVEPGDVIAWVKLDREPGDNTGHVMLVEEKPVADGPNQFRVRVLDSTLHGHGQDSRVEGQSGIGRGTIWIEVDDDGEPIGFRWKSRRGMLHEVPIAIGRAIALRQ
jgi:hypothetical protein